MENSPVAVRAVRRDERIAAVGLEKTTLMPPPAPAGRARVPGAEPLAGYRLIEPLGSGGFGEVWKCEVPGGLYKAIKFCEGGGHGTAAPGSPAARELEALQRVKAIRHPFLLSIERVEVHDGQLLIVMELADKNLQRLLVEYQAAGLPGIPREELLGYMAEAAEALDVLNVQHGLQHLDVKPHNLFVVSNHIKVGDFGLVHRLPAENDGAGRRAGGGTPLYAAPEILQNSLSRHSDQYSLAIVFQQLLTGTVPFWSPQPYNLVMQHLSAAPNLSALPPGDRPVVARALAKDPAQRFPSCLEFVQALDGARAVNGTGSGLVRRPPGLRPGAGEPVPAAAERTLLTPPPAGPVARPAAEVPTRITAFRSPSVGFAAPAARPPTHSPSTSLALPGFRFLTCLAKNPLVDLWTVQDPAGRERLAHCVVNRGAAGDVLEQLRRLRHPALPPAEVFAAPGGRVVLVSDLGRPTLRDRCAEYQTQGRPGVPRAELLGYLRAAAEALDELHQRHGLQHLGLNPGNLLVQDGRLWLGDFGLIPLFWLPAGHAAAQLNARYAAPELAEPTASATADQYSLALIYAEMLTGIYPRGKAAGGSKAGLVRRPNLADARPGAGRTGRSALRVDLDFLPADDRPVVARALADDPAGRFPSCAAFVAALEAATVAPAPQDRPAAELPLVVPVGALRGQPIPPDFAAPDPGPLLAELAAGSTGAVLVPASENVRYVVRRDGSWEYRCPVQLFAGLLKLKLEGFRQHWNAELVRDEGHLYIFRIPTGDSGGARAFWPRGPARPAGLEVQVRLAASADAPSQLREAVTRVIAPGGTRDAPLLRDLAPRLFQSVRAYLQGVPEQRADERWPFTQALHVYAVLPNLELAGPLEARGRNVSRGGVRFLVTEWPPTELVYLHFRESTALKGLALLARVARAQELGDGRFELGVTFAVDGPARGPDTRPAWEWVD